MGIRVKKALGFGLTDVKCEGNELADDRFFDMGIMESRHRYNTWTREGFLAYLEAHKGDDYDARFCKYMILEKEKLTGHQFDPLDLIHYDGEYGLPNVLLITPPSYFESNNVYRSDNTLDWHEETELYNQENRVVELTRNIFPWSSLHADRRDGRRLDPRFSSHYMRHENRMKDKANPLPASNNDIQGFIEIQNATAKLMGFENYDDARAYIANYVPLEVTLFCKWTNMFVDESTIFTLKPLLYVWWA